MSAFRCVIFAAVSTPGQAEDEKASIPSQIANARALIERRGGWQEVGPPLVVPGQSRSIDFLHEAVAEVAAIADLIDLAKRAEVDLVIVRDYDRLARTRTLLTQISTYLSHCGIQIYALDKPVEPVPVADIRRKHTVYSSATVEAFAGLEAEREVARLVERRYFGINSAMAKGKWIAPLTCYGYTRESANGGSTNRIEIVPEEIAIIRRIDSMYLDEGLGTIAIARQLNTERIPSPSGKQWHAHVINDILWRPFYAGYIVWGLKRSQKTFDPKLNELVNRATWVPSYLRLKEDLGRRPGLIDFLDHIDELEEDGVVVAEGDHEAIRSLDLQRIIERELYIRYAAKGRAASVENTHLFAGMLTCGDCGSAFSSHVGHGVVRYGCLARRSGLLGCENSGWIREDDLYQAVMGVLQYFANNPETIDTYLERLDRGNRGTLEAEAVRLSEMVDNVAVRRERWDRAYEADVIDLDTYGQRVGDLAEEQTRLEQRLQSVRKRIQQDDSRASQREFLLRAVDHIPALDPDNMRELKLALRRVVADITILDSKPIKIIFR